LEWEVFERLFSEDFSIDLLRSWQKVRKGGFFFGCQHVIFILEKKNIFYVEIE